ncbi:MAG: penicillin-binding protein 1C [Bacteroidales bacterium]|nr:penicillin-binding protein 1C [Bacteroidales bacterium]
MRAGFHTIIAIICVIGGLAIIWPRRVFKDVPYSTVVLSEEGDLLGARIAADGQWRFPPSGAVPERFRTALVQFEDRRFRWHPGVDLLALGRALRDNIASRRVVSGGSTITMQVVRLSRGKERTLWQKTLEAFGALSLEFRYSKDEILSMYAAHAPFGGNVVGLDAAAWRYFGLPAEALSWGESALLAVLPNAPSSLHPGKGREELLLKRNRLLLRLLEHGDISMETYEDALSEPLPLKPQPLPSYASHFVDGCPSGVVTHSTIRLPLQRAVEEAVSVRSDALASDGVADMAALVIDNSAGNIVAYVGNSSPSRKRPGLEVDIARSPRSTGSILKPLLYAAALEDGTILPRTLLPDIPVNLGGFAPQNFDREFYGAVSAAKALARSLNVPAVFLLRSYGVARFYDVLKAAGLTTLSHEPDHYGLSLILGGAEGRLTEIAAAYSGLVQDFVRGKGQKPGRTVNERNQAALWYTFEALKEVNRPDQLDWRLIGSVRKAAWKTGTSYGFRDAWAIGMTPSYTIGIWAGNASGEGVPGLTGARAAGPAMFDILNILPESPWFDPPLDSGVRADVCMASGHLAGPECPATESILLPPAALESAPCPYHKDGTFVLPPSMEWYYRPHHPEYTGAKRSISGGEVMEFIYPSVQGSVLRLPAQLGGGRAGAVFRVAHRKEGTTLWWHLDGSFAGETILVHELRLCPPPGPHTLTVTDPAGESISISFRIE